MAQALRFLCSGCHRAIEAWSDGNPYYFDSAGVKQYAYHPDHENLARCVGNDTPHLCLGCGAACNVDTRATTAVCKVCGAAELVEKYQLGGHQCPYCMAGEFALDPNYHCIL